MTMQRRRFLTLSAAAIASPVLGADVQEWHGRAFGAATRITLTGTDVHKATRLFQRIEAEVVRIESHFSLHVDSALTRLNRDGRLAWPAPEILALFDLAGQVHAATGGAFDPTVQPLWQAMAIGGDVMRARRLLGWSKVRVSNAEIALPPGAALTFNGIAQGQAADRRAAMVRKPGFGDVLIDMGEIIALGQNPQGRAWRADIALPDGQVVARHILHGALATSAPMGTVIGAGLPHILDPQGAPPRWHLASVEAPQAAVADALSTAFCVMNPGQITRALAQFPLTRLIALT
ncbi:MAG: FAD:protein FMN transferase [Paracoccaceae bacterium]|nr:FAD:protein FMN transferase [Paracoccaceae bacterium]